MVRAWEVTRHYIEMEEKCLNDKSLSDEQKQELRNYYEQQ